MGSKYNTRQRMTSPYVSVSDSFVLDISVSKAVATSAPKNATLEGTLLYKFPTTVVKESFEATWDSHKQHYHVVSSSISATISDSEKIKVTYDGEVYTLYNDSSESHLDLASNDAVSSLTTVISDVDTIKTEQISDRAVATSNTENITTLSSDLTTVTSDVVTIKTIANASSPSLELNDKGKEFYYKLEDFKAVTSEGKDIWQDFQYKGIDKDYTGHERSGGSVGDDVKSAHGNEVHGAFAVPIHSDNECSIVMGYLHFVESGRVTDPEIGFSGEILSTMAKVYVILNDENTLSYGITSNELVSGFYHLDEDVIVKMISNTKTGPFGKNTKLFSDAVDYKTLRIRKINDSIRKCVLSIEEDPVSFDSDLSILSSPMTSVAQSTATIHKKFYYNGANFKAVSADGSKTIYQDYQYISIDKNYTGHGDDGKVGDYVKYGRGNLARTDLSIEITSDSAGMNRIGEMKWIATALINEPDLAVGSQTNGILTTEEIWFKLDGEDEDTVCLGHAMNRTDGPNEPGGGFYPVNQDIMVQIIKNAHVGPFDEHGNFTNFSNFKSMRIRNIGGGIRECVVSTDDHPPTFEQGEDPVPVSLELATADEKDVEFYYSGDDFSSGDMYQDYQYVSIDEDYTGHDEFGKNVQNARGNIVYGIWSVPLYADSDLTTIIGGITWANSVATVPDPSLPFMDQDLTVSDDIFITLDNVSTMAIGHTSNIIKGGYYELNRDVLVDIVDTVNEGPLAKNAKHTTATPAYKTCRLRKIDSTLRKGVISKSSIYPALY